MCLYIFFKMDVFIFLDNSFSTIYFFCICSICSSTVPTPPLRRARGNVP
jgi:hypothetical protein